MTTITANELKQKGVSVIRGVEEAIVTVRGKACYVVLDIPRYNHLREAELEMALIEAKNDIAEGKFVTKIKDHLKRMMK